MRNFFFLLIVLLTASICPAQDWAKKRLEDSPRHLEWITVRSGERRVKCFVAYPEVKSKAPAILLIHEIFGLTDWVRSLADQLAEAGYVVIAPDLLSGMGPQGGDTASFGGDDRARQAVSELPPEQVTADLNAAADAVLKLPASKGPLTVMGFCWGGTQTFRFATSRKGLKQSLVFYGSGPDDVSGITAPVYGFYAENDARIGQTLPATISAMKAAGKTFQPKTYAGAGHGFMRAGEAPGATAANRQARQDAWQRVLHLLKSQ